MQGRGGAIQRDNRLAEVRRCPESGEGQLFTAGEEAVRLQELEGNTVTIHTGLTGVQSDAHILWFYRSEKADIKIVNSLEFEGKTKTDYNRDRFRDRLQLDRSSGSLTIRNISREDSGVYKLQIITGTSSDWSFRVKVYALVSKPVIRNPTTRPSGGSSQSCSLQCSVENGEDVTLSWYEEKERISSISRSDSSERLHLPLNRTFPNSYTYTCESANPVSYQITQLNIAELCDFNSGRSSSVVLFTSCRSSVHCCGSVEFVVRLGLSAMLVLAILGILLYHFSFRTASNGGLDRKSHH
ncbi:CD48 antigen-like [Salminus brasiliensis]|uniref:CD48 antigen-like n=1 Tax=Salminus brasiliensis TaxID=930266 RepID=UPI003B82FE86